MQRLLKVGTLCATLLAFPPISNAANPPTWPEHSVRLVLGVSPGGSSDTILRVLAQGLNESLSQTFVVENKPGATGNIAAEHVARAEPDGYTFLMASVANAIKPSVFKNLPFNFLGDFKPVALVARLPSVLLVNRDVPVNSIDELLALAKTPSGGLSYASPGAASPAHIKGEQLSLIGSAKLLHVPYKGTAPAFNDLIGGRVQIMFDVVGVAMPHLSSGALRALAVSGPDRSASLPNTPTFEEAGYPGLEQDSWFALMAPIATPDWIVEKLNREVVKVMHSDAALKALSEYAIVPSSLKPGQVREFIQTDTEKWGEVVRKAKISLE